MDDIRQDVKEVKNNVLELVKQGAVHNTLLREHERRSLALEELVFPMQRKVYTAEKILKVVVAVFIGIAIQKISARF